MMSFFGIRKRQGAVIAAVAGLALVAPATMVVDSPQAARAESTGRVYGITGSLTAGSFAEFSVIEESSNSLVFADSNNGKASILDTKTGKVRKTLALKHGGGPLATSSSTGLVYLAGEAGVLSAINPRTGAIVFTTSAPSYANAIAVDNARGIVWVASGYEHKLAAYDATTGVRVGDEIMLDDYVRSIAVDESTHELYLAGENISVMDESTRDITSSVAVGGALLNLVVDPETHTAFASPYALGEIVRLKGQELERFEVTHSPTAMTLDPLSNDLVTIRNDYNGTAIEALDRDTLELTRRVLLPTTGTSLAVAPVSGAAYVGYSSSRDVTVLTKGVKPVITSTIPTDARETIRLDATLTATGDGPISWRVYRGTPPGVSIDWTTGRITGRPTAHGTTRLELSAINPFGADYLSGDFVVAPPQPHAPDVGVVSFSSELVRGRYEYYAGSVGDWGGYPAPTFTAKGLPHGLKMTANGRIFGAPEKRGVYTVTVTAKNASGKASRTKQVRIIAKGYGHAGADFPGRSTRLPGVSRDELRAAVKQIPKGATITNVEIAGAAQYSSSKDKATAQRLAKERAWAFANYAKKLGISTKPSYGYYVENRKKSGHFNSSIDIFYTYH